MDEINDRAEADRIKFEREQEERIKRSKNLSEEMGNRGVPDSKKPV